MGSRSPFFAPYEAYRTADGYLVVVGTGGQDAWGALCRVLGLDVLIDDPRFATNSDRVANAEELKDELEAVLSTRSSADWVDVLTGAGVVCAPVQRLPEVLESEHARVLRMVGRLSHPVAGEVPTVRLPVTLSDARLTAETPPPLLGADSESGFAGG
jgi:crotonobetainyl-CoA:carnitine CoA-transferase CaiB-like acyl-CoA transferase